MLHIYVPTCMCAQVRVCMFVCACVCGHVRVHVCLACLFSQNKKANLHHLNSNFSKHLFSIHSLYRKLLSREES